MNRLWLLAGSIFLFFLLLFGAFMAFGLDFEEIPDRLGGMTLALAGLLAIGLLIADVFLPIPSSLIMIANGALLGTLGGGMLSLVGGTGAALTGYWVGRMGQKVAQKWVKESELARGKQFFDRWGLFSVILSRPIPLISETVAVVAGLCKMRFAPLLIGSLAGNIPAAFIYAWAGANLRQDPLGLLPLAAVLGIAVVSFVIGKWLQPSPERP
jgi:uncharacterized membrane protein YdjX (TVP38/TMEM64 family)